MSPVLGPFRVKEYKPGAYVELERNPSYWKRDAAGHPLPYIDAIRLDIQQNREIELLRFERGELQLINTLEPEHFERLSAQMPHSVYDSGPGMDSEFRRPSVATIYAGWCIGDTRRPPRVRCRPRIING
jgi:peptide/nickel transport system substrate-binding protein